MSQTPGNRRIYLSPQPGRAGEGADARARFELDHHHGARVELFEQEMCRKLDVGHAVALSSGTAGLHLALLVLGVGPGDEVICSDLTFAATVNAVKYCGAHPVRSTPTSTWNMDPGLRGELSARERGAVHAGDPARRPLRAVRRYTAILAIAARYGIPVVEDAAEALGAEMGHPRGAFGAMGVLSFNGNKIITTSGGGMLVSDDGACIERARYLATQAREPVVHYQHSEVGYNYRLSNILAGIGRGQLERLGEKVDKKREVNRYYREALGDLPGIRFMPEAPTEIELLAHRHPGRCRPVRRGPGGIRLALERENIESRPVWKPMHLQPAYRDCRFRGTGAGERIFERGLCLPSGAQLRLTDLERIVGVITGAGRPRS